MRLWELTADWHLFTAVTQNVSKGKNTVNAVHSFQQGTRGGARTIHLIMNLNRWQLNETVQHLLNNEHHVG